MKESPKLSRTEAELLDRIIWTERRREVERFAREIPKGYRMNYLRSATGKASLRNAVKAFCLNCTGYDRSAISDCTVLDCPLWAYRPFADD